MTASLYEKNSRYHVMLSWYHENGKRERKSIATGIPIQGNNKRKAETARKELLAEWEKKITDNYTDMLFSDYLPQWLESVRHSIAETTYCEYRKTIAKRICPYFAERKIKLQDLKPYHIHDFYRWKMDTCKVSAGTIYRYHANINKALRNAYEMERIPENPASKVTLPKQEKYRGDYYTPLELRKLVSVVKGTKLEVPVMLESWFGMRRGEIVGCRWDAINFETKTLYMRGTVTDKGNGSRMENLTYRDYAKTPSSIRTFPLTDAMIKYLKALRQKQSGNRLLAGQGYNQKWVDFLCIDQIGNLIHPEYISRRFPVVLKMNGLRKIRFHDLRHTFATVLLEERENPRIVADMMGHEKISTTLDLYSHVVTNSVYEQTAQKLDGVYEKLTKKKNPTSSSQPAGLSE